MLVPQRTKAIATVALGGAALWLGKEMVPNRKERVMWGVNGQLEHWNETAERRRERETRGGGSGGFGFVPRASMRDGAGGAKLGDAGTEVVDDWRGRMQGWAERTM